MSLNLFLKLVISNAPISFGFALVLSILKVGLELGLVWLFTLLVMGPGDKHRLPELLKGFESSTLDITLLMFAVVLLRLFVSLAVGFCKANIEGKSVKNLARKLFSNNLSDPNSDIARIRFLVGYELPNVQKSISDLLRACQSLFTILFYVVVLIVSGIFSLGILAFLVISSIIFLCLKVSARSYSEKLFESREIVSQVMGEAEEFYKNCIGGQFKSYFLLKFAGALNVFAKVNILVGILLAATSSLSEVLLVLTLVVSYFLGLGLAEFIVLAVALFRISGHATSLQNSLIKFNVHRRSFDSLWEALEKPPVYAVAEQTASNLPTYERGKHVEFQNVAKDVMGKDLIFEAVRGSLKCPMGSVVGITGVSGVGKSHFLKKFAVSLLTDADRQVTEVPNPSDCLYLTNTYVHIGDDLMESLLGDAVFDRAKVQSYLGAIGGFTSADERRFIYSAGEGQRLNLIRAFIDKPEILILDESLSNLDEAKVEICLGLIREHLPSALIILVSHSSWVLLRCDAVIHVSQDKGTDYQTGNKKGIVEPTK